MCLRSIHVRGHTKVRLLVQGFEIDLANTSDNGIYVGRVDLPNRQEEFFSRVMQCRVKDAVA